MRFIQIFNNPHGLLYVRSSQRRNKLIESLNNKLMSGLLLVKYNSLLVSLLYGTGEVSEVSESLHEV